MYGITATHYLTGIAPGLLLLVPPMEIFFDLQPVNLSVGVGPVAARLRRLLRDADPAGLLHRSAASAGRC